MVPPRNANRFTPLSYNGTLVLQALAKGHKYGFEIMRVTALKSGTVYPLLRRLEAGGLVQSNWEKTDQAFDEGRPARRYYEPTPAGERALSEALQRLAAQRHLLDEAPA
jgi:DNA-binding PadR family transcriptional regulator